MEEHKQYLNENADEQERLAAEQVMEGLQELRLQARVHEVALERAALYRRIFWRRFFLSLVALVMITGAAYLLFGKKDTTLDPSTQKQSIEQQADPSLPANQQDTPPQNTNGRKIDRPVAQLDPAERLPDPRYPAPDATSFRGEEQAGQNLKKLLNQMWYTGYPLTGLRVQEPFLKAHTNLKNRDFDAAYIELDRLESQYAQNDTLRYMKGYCLLEMGEAYEAQTYLSSLQGKHAAWEAQLQWYRGLAMLLAGEQDKALAQFRQIAARPQHPYYKQAKKAVGLLSR
ncbi:MAG: hypothetical protein JNM22_12250 [Saprospiraceae bacterium]|nr:hypothetical protein [Saprospiraceae bacterium]